jgi:Cysteine-rich secretory protein family
MFRCITEQKMYMRRETSIGRPRLGRLASCAVLLLLVACRGGDDDGSPAAPTPPPDPNLAFCVDQTNRYRASVGAPALARSGALDAYAAAAARADGTNRVAHGYFRMTSGGGIAVAENQIPWWPLETLINVRRVIEVGLAQFWGEGVNGGHYRNMANTRHTEIGCGVFVADDLATVVQAFR